jgi:hypothetical protein
VLARAFVILILIMIVAWIVGGLLRDRKRR